MTHAKKVRLESGRMVKGKNVKLGDLYEKWQKKTSKSVGRSGVFDDVGMDTGGDGDGDGDGNGDGDGKKTPKTMNPRWMTKEKMEAKLERRSKVDGDLKSTRDIKKKREEKAKNKVKNMKKSDRRV